MKTKTASTTNPINRSPLRCGLFLIPLVLAATATTSAEGGTPSVRRPIAMSGQGTFWQAAPSEAGTPESIAGTAPASVTITSSTVDTDLYTGYENAIFAPDDNTVYVAYKRFLSDPTVPGYIPAELRIARSIDAGETWTISVVDPDAIEEGDTLNNSVSIDGYRGSVIYVAYFIQPSGLFADAKLRVAKSTDGGSTWTTQTVAQGAGGDQNSIRVLNPNTAVISVHANGAAEGIHTFITRDGGTTWSDTLVAGVSGTATTRRWERWIHARSGSVTTTVFTRTTKI